MSKAEQNIINEKVKEAWNKGMVVVCAAGNNGPAPSTVTAPGSCETIITVGAFDEYRHRQTRYSGRGPTKDCVIKPEFVAPGNNILSCGLKQGYTKKSGTSMAVPVISGMIALLLEKYPYMTPVQVKQALYHVCKMHKNSRDGIWGMPYCDELLNNTLWSDENKTLNIV